jgi:hypothetical protein
MSKKAKSQSFNVRVVLVDGQFQFSEKCFMHRLRNTKRYSDFVDGTKKQRRILEDQLDGVSTVK